MMRRKILRILGNFRSNILSDHLPGNGQIELFYEFVDSFEPVSPQMVCTDGLW